MIELADPKTLLADELTLVGVAVGVVLGQDLGDEVLAIVDRVRHEVSVERDENVEREPGCLVPHLVTPAVERRA